MEIATLHSSQLSASHTSRSTSRVSQMSRSASHASQSWDSGLDDSQTSESNLDPASVNSLSACVLVPSAASCLDVQGLAAELGFSKKAVAARTHPGTTFLVPTASPRIVGTFRLLPAEGVAAFVPCSWATVADTDTLPRCTEGDFMFAEGGGGASVFAVEVDGGLDVCS